MIFFIIFVIIFLYCHSGFWYAKGMAKYIENNYRKSKNDEAQACWKSVLIEYEELKEALCMRSPIDIILEGGDVLHALIKWYLVKKLSVNTLKRIWIWLLVFPLVLVCTIKLGRRYYYNGCIRNHKNPNNRDHLCFVQDEVKAN